MLGLYCHGFWRRVVARERPPLPVSATSANRSGRNKTLLLSSGKHQIVWLSQNPDAWASYNVGMSQQTPLWDRSLRDTHCGSCGRRHRTHLPRLLSSR
jgi:hypothetical protein